MSKRDLLNKAFNEIDNGYINDAMSYRAEKKERTGPRRALTVLGAAALVAAFAGLSLFLLKIAHKPTNIPEASAGTDTAYTDDPLYELRRSDIFGELVPEKAAFPEGYDAFYNSSVNGEFGSATINIYDNRNSALEKAENSLWGKDSIAFTGDDYITIELYTVITEDVEINDGGTPYTVNKTDLSRWTDFSDFSKESFVVSEWNEHPAADPLTHEIEKKNSRIYLAMINGGKCTFTFKYVDVENETSLTTDALYNIIESCQFFKID